MFSRVLVKEMDGLKQTLMNLREDITDTVQKTSTIDDQYVRAKAEHEMQMLTLATVLSKQKKKLDELEDEEADLDLKLNSLDTLITEQQISSREETDELQRVKTNNAEEVNTTNKIIQSLSRSIKKAELELKDDEEYMASLEHNFEINKATRGRELTEKLEKIRHAHALRMKAAEDKYNAKLEPLIYRIKCLDEDIEKAENEINTKPKEEAALIKRHDMLEKKREKAAMAR